MMGFDGRKKVSVILAAMLLTAAGFGYRFLAGGQAAGESRKITDYPESAQAAESGSADPETAKETAAAVSTEDTAAAEDETAGTAVPEEPADETGEAALETGEAAQEKTEGAPPLQLGESATAELISGFNFSAFSAHEAIVYDYSQLKSALANNNGITTVYFGADITMQTTGIRINPNKAHVVIDGFNPLEPEQARPHVLTDYSSSSFTDTIYINAAGTNTLHVRDLTIVGKNYYGPFSVSDSSALAGIVVTYERVDYNGPQLGYHRKGTIRLKDCKVRIHGGNGGSSNQEFSEAKHVIFEGANTIETETSTTSIFWIPAGGTFEIQDDSSLVLVSPNTSSTYGVFYADSSSNKIDISVGERAALDATISGVVAPDAYATLSGLSVREGGAFNLRTTKAAAAPVLSMGGALTVEKDAEFIISGYGGASYALLRQASGDITVGKDATFRLIGESAYAALLNLIGRAFICNDPASVLLYNANRDILASNSAGRVHVDAQQVNYWNALSAGGLDNPPRYRWSKADKTNFLIDGTLATGADGNFSSLSSNYTAGDSPGAAPSAETFSMADARVLAFGRLNLTVIAPTTKSTAISGVTAPGATVRASFTQQGVDYTLPDVTADSAGVFQIPAGVALTESTVVVVKSNWQYLTATAEAVVGGEGKLEFFVPDLMEFFITELSPFTKMVKRLDPNWGIVVSDARGAGGGWRIYARLDSELTPASPNRPALNGALVYVGESGNQTVMIPGTEMLILTHTSAEGEEVFPLSWTDNQGVLLSVKPGTAFADTVYNASISWTLIDAP